MRLAGDNADSGRVSQTADYRRLGPYAYAMSTGRAPRRRELA